MTFNLSEHNTIANVFLSELRSTSIQTDRMRFRRNMERLGEVLAYEISRTLTYEKLDIETPLGIAPTSMPKQNIVIATILRAGLPFYQGFLNYFDQANSSFISAYRKHHKDGSFDIHCEYLSCPDLNGCTLILVDPMVASGASIDIAMKKLLEVGTPDKVHFATCIASSYGFEYIRRLYPDAGFWMAGLDDELTAKSYIVPGLGDAGDLAFGPKLQE